MAGCKEATEGWFRLARILGLNELSAEGYLIRHVAPESVGELRRDATAMQVLDIDDAIGNRAVPVVRLSLRDDEFAKV